MIYYSKHAVYRQHLVNYFGSLRIMFLNKPNKCYVSTQHSHNFDPNTNTPNLQCLATTILHPSVIFTWHQLTREKQMEIFCNQHKSLNFFFSHRVLQILKYLQF